MKRRSAMHGASALCSRTKSSLPSSWSGTGGGKANAFGSKSDGEADGEDAHPAGLMGSGAAKANTLTKPLGGENTDAAAEWDQTASNTKDAWDFGDNMQAPALKYADYDGTGLVV